jgi:hypothetical protein
MTVTLDGVNFDQITRMLAEQVVAGINEIEEANVILLAEAGETGDREIDKAFKDEKVEDKASVDLWNKAEKARETYRKLLTEARNTYRKNVLGEDEKPDSEVDKDTLKEKRKTVMASLGLIGDFAKANGLKDVSEWVTTVNVPQVGRQGSSGVTGTKKPRAYVKFGGNTYESFGEAAKALSIALSTDDNKVTVSSGDLVQAWSDAGETEKFTFRDTEFTVTPKNQEKAA